MAAPCGAGGLQHFLAAGFDDLLINAPLLRRQFAERHLFQLRRQIRRHFLLEPPQQKGAQPPRQPRLGGGVLFARDGQFVALAKILRRAQVAGHEKVEDGPEIEHGIFHRRAGQHQPVLRRHGLDRLRVLGLPVLDVLRFVQHQRVEFQPAIQFGVAADQRVACQDNIARRDLVKPGAPLRPVQREHFQFRREFAAPPPAS